MDWFLFDRDLCAPLIRVHVIMIHQIWSHDNVNRKTRFILHNQLHVDVLPFSLNQNMVFQSNSS